MESSANYRRLDLGTYIHIHFINDGSFGFRFFY